MADHAGVEGLLNDRQRAVPIRQYSCHALRAVVLFWLALIFTSGFAAGNDHAAEIGELKGQAEALQAAHRSKGCVSAA